ncbi:fibronectin type III domain-containing protein [Chengkuizengella axinellae]|uniref:glucan endo-1,3-beta-D-glucosidase n=1 Tax=Chengkuizengella axinellae TaxID=3064388 RepID=A0ABT9IZZ8_9BACL|nr:glycosyl hydrolase [Chengkuizengella sp. 2205SS18-9]MDP5274956.1 glycosyl hydrolase [Chengkuizengella sp. 2205SS18-9]
MKKTFTFSLVICLVMSLLVPFSTSSAFDGEVQVGSGSYTTILPAETDKPATWFIDPNAQAYPEPQPFISSNVTGPDAPEWKPTPTSDWWTNMNWDTFSEPQYPHPLAVYPKTQGLQIYYPGNSKLVGASGISATNDVVYPEQGFITAELPKDTSNDFVLGHSSVGGFSEAKTGGFSDWFVTADFNNGGAGMSVSYGHGSPFVYAIYEGGNPSLTFDRAPEVFVGTENDAIVGVSINGNYYALFGPTGSTWSGLGTTTLVNNLPVGKNYFSLALLPDVKSEAEAISVFDQMKEYAYSFVTDTKVNWSFDEAASKVYTNYQFTITPKESGAPNETWMTLYATQWRGMDADYTGYTYDSMQGELKTLIGNSFTIEDTYTGVLPNLPYLGDLNADNIAQLKFYLEEEINRHFPNPEDPNSNPGDVDTYFTGKEMARLTTLYGLAEDIANRVSDPADKSEFENLAAIALDKAKIMVTDWLTASDENGNQDNQEFFYYNDTWGAMIGYREGFYSAPNMTDHHFHYGYFIKAAAEIARADEQFLTEYGEMVDMLIRHIASPDRDDAMFPFLRNYDPYAGHSWADGKSGFGAGNNQESVSEAINAWTGIVLWGELLSTLPGKEAEGKEIRDLGIYLYTSEVDASNEYYFNLNNDIYPEEWEQVAHTIVWGGKVDNATFWTKNPAQRHAILWLPFHGGSLYLGQDKDYVLKSYNSLQAELPLFEAWGRAEEAGNANYDFDAEAYWDDLQWMYLALADPVQALQLMNNAIAASPDGLFRVEEGNSVSYTYSWIHTLLNVGAVDATVQADYPFYAVFKDDSGEKTYVVYNMTNETKIVNFSDGQQITVAPKSFNADQGVYIPDTNPPSVPVGLSVKRVASDYVTIEWEPSTDDRGVVEYDIFVDGNYAASSTLEEVKIEGLNPTTTYNFTVKAKDVDTKSGESSTLQVSTTIIDTQAPDVPTGITSLEETHKSIALDWSESADNILTVEYDIYRDGIKVITTENSSFEDIGLEPLTFYSYEIVARDADGNESARSEIFEVRSGFEPGPGYTQEIIETTPTTATVIVEPNSSIDEVILLVGINGAGESGYSLAKNAEGNFEMALTVPENANLTYRYNTIVNGVATLSKYFNYDMGQKPGDIVIDTEAPTAPTDLNYTAISETTVNLSWTAATDNVGVNGYDVYQNGAFLSTTTETAFPVTGLEPSTTYVFTVVAKDDAGNESLASNELQITTAALPVDIEAPTVPANLTFTAKSETTIDLSWTASTDNVGVTGYDVYQDGILVSSTASTVYLVTDLIANTTYTFTVLAKDETGNVSAESNVLTVTTDAAPVPGDGNVIVGPDFSVEIVDSGNSVTLKFIPEGTAGFADVHYKVNNGAQQNVGSVNENGIWEYTIQGLNAGDVVDFQYTYFINFGQDSDWYQYVVGSGGTTDPVPPVEPEVPTEPEEPTVDTEAPSAPSNVTITAKGETTVDLAWTASTDNVGVTEYDVYKDGMLDGTTTDVFYTTTGLTENTTYTFSVVAKDEEGNESVASQNLQVTTDATPEMPTEPEVPIDPTAPHGVTYNNDQEATIWFTPEENAAYDYIILHYTVNDGPQENPTLVYNASTARYEFTVTNGQVIENIQYGFTYRIAGQFQQDIPMVTSTP